MSCDRERLTSECLDLASQNILAEQVTSELINVLSDSDLRKLRMLMQAHRSEERCILQLIFSRDELYVDPDINTVLWNFLHS